MLRFDKSHRNVRRGRYELAGIVVGFRMAQEAARHVYEASGVGPGDVDVVELHRIGFVVDDLPRS
jgi:hypothetical protein